MWGNAVSVAENRPERYAKNITIRYPIRMPFAGEALRLTFDNYCGTEPITLNKTTLLHQGRFCTVTFGGEKAVTIPAGEAAVSDPVTVEVQAEDVIQISFYLADFTLMRSVVFTCGPLSQGLYANGDETENADISIETSRKTQLFYFLSNVSLLAAEDKHTVICYGDSITAQDWPDDLALRCRNEGFNRTAIIRRATSGSRILREYHCLTYESYGLKGSNRFHHEIPTDGADAVIIQQGINDIIHPVGTQINPFRPMSDLPTIDELISGMVYYIDQCRKKGLQVYLGTLLPIYGWRTYAPFREELKNEFNDWLRHTTLSDGCIDFDAVVKDCDHPEAFAAGYDSGDHLHPSAAAYQAMGEAVSQFLSDKLC